MIQLNSMTVGRNQWFSMESNHWNWGSQRPSMESMEFL